MNLVAVFIVCGTITALAPWRALQFVSGTIIVETLIDFGLVKRLAPPKARYFFLHLAFNTWLSVVVWNDAMDALRFPAKGMEGDAESPGFCDSAVITTAGITGFHVYHTLFFTGISAEDWIHHIVSCVIVPLIGINAPYGHVVAVSNLGMCGIPGAADYAMLAAVKCGVLNSITEKRLNSLLNLLLRWPLQLLASYIFCVGWANGTLKSTSALGALPWVRGTMAIGVILHTANAAYYCQKVIGNYHVKAEKEEATNAATAVTEKKK